MDEDEGLWWCLLGKVFDRSLGVIKCGGLVELGKVDSVSKRKPEYEGMIGDEGAELPLSDAVRCREGLVSVEDLFDASP